MVPFLLHLFCVEIFEKENHNTFQMVQQRTDCPSNPPFPEILPPPTGRWYVLCNGVLVLGIPGTEDHVRNKVYLSLFCTSRASVASFRLLSQNFPTAMRPAAPPLANTIPRWKGNGPIGCLIVPNRPTHYSPAIVGVAARLENTREYRLQRQPRLRRPVW